jgi:hypothetical protein
VKFFNDPAWRTIVGIVPDVAVGLNDDAMGGARGIAVDPTGTYVAVAFSGFAATMAADTSPVRFH